MQISGEFRVDAPAEAVWSVIMDPAQLCVLASSCEDARQIDATHYEGTIRARLRIVTVHAYARGKMLEAKEAESMKVALSGETKGLPGTFRGIMDLKLLRVNGDTVGRYDFDMHVLGRVGSLGEPFVRLAAQRLANTFAKKLSAHLRGR